MMKNMMTGIRTNRTLKLSHLLIAFFLVMGTFVVSFSAKAHSVAVFIEIGNGTNGGANGQVRFHALTWHGFTGTSGSMRVNGTWYAFVRSFTLGGTTDVGGRDFLGLSSTTVPTNQLSNYRRVASCSGWESNNTWGYTFQSTNWISGINLCASMSFSMTGFYLEEPACNLSGSVDVSQPVIVSQPAYSPSSSVCEGSNLNVSVIASGINLTYQWEHSSNGTSWTTIAGATAATYTAMANTSSGSLNGPNSRYRCIVTSSGSCGVKSATSTSSSVLSVTGLPSITTQPISALTLCSGSSTQISVVASGSGLSYKWQKNDGSGFTDFSPSRTGSTLAITAATTGDFSNGVRYQCLVSNSCGTPRTSSPTTLTVNPSTTVSSPSSTTICENSGATFTVTAGSTQNPTYQWQVSRNGGASFSNISDGIVAGTVTYSGTTSAILVLSGATASLNNARYRCVVNGTCGSATSATPATLTINRFSAISVEPTSQTACLSLPTTTPAVFSVSATGSSLSYTWQSAGSITGTFSNVSNSAGITHALSNGGAQLTVTPADETYSGHVYRVLINGACGSTITSSTVTLTVATPAVVAPISNSTPSVCEAGTVSLSVSATGSNLSYRWQESISGGTFTNVTASNYRGVTTNTLTILGAPTDFSGRAYRAVVTGTCGSAANSGTITLTVNANPSISVQPVNQNICLPNAATFSVTAAGFSLTYQWETSTDGGVTYSNVSSAAGVATYTGSTTSSLSVDASGTLNQNRYRVKITGGCGNPIYSDARILTVNSLPNITSQPLANTSICVFASGTISLTDAGLGNSYQWQVSETRGGGTFTNTANTTTTTGISYAGVTTTKLTIGRVPVEQDGFLYRCIITPSTACGLSTTTSGTVTLTVNTRPAITIQPVNANNNTFLQNNQFGSITTTTYVYRVTATGSYTTPSNDLVWYESRDGGQSWRSISSGSLSGTTLYTVSTTGTSPVVSELRVRMENSTVATSDYALRLGYIYRCLLSGICENVTTNAVKVNPPPKVNRRQ